jgi:hypothetical protein
MPKDRLPTFPMFRELRIQDREWLQGSFNRLPPETSDQNFTSLFMWRHNYNVQISQLNGCVCLHCAPVEEGEFFFAPVGQIGVREAAETCFAFLKEQGKAPLLGRVPENTVKRHFADRTRFSVSEDRDSFDYVYTTEHLITLSGRSYHGQRNHIRRFRRRYPDYSLEPVGPENTAECRELAEKWFTIKQRILLERPGLSPEALAYEQALMEDERVAIKEVFAHFRELPVTGLAVRVGGHIRAFAVGEPLTKDTVVIHLEKADRDYHGLGQFICQAFCEYVWADDYRFINREEDLGFEGLRTAKLALGPHHLTKKYTVTWA